jgi:hypothetical protein
MSKDRVWINFPFLMQPERFDYFKTALLTLKEWPVDDIKVVVFTNDKNHEELRQLVTGIFPTAEILASHYFFSDPMLMTWEHKLQLPLFLKSDYTHFIAADADLKIPYNVFEYFVETRKLFKEHDMNWLIPGTFRVEDYGGYERAVDTTFRTDVDSLRFLVVGGQVFYSPQEPFQGISIMDREMALEHYTSPYIDPKTIGVYGFGISETALSAYIFHETPSRWDHRVVIPVDDYTKTFIYHLPCNYAAWEGKEHGKIPVYDFFRRVKEVYDRV